MRIELVIARYNENLDWLEDVPKNIRITIYNKGKDDIPYPYISLPNVGRESHTYLYHIIQNYDNLADKTIFCQGDTIFHSPEFIKLLENTDKFEAVQPLSAYYWPQDEPPFYFSNPPLPVLEKTRNLWIKGCPIHVEYMDNEFTTRYPHLYFENYFVKVTDWVKKEYGVDNAFKFWVDRFRLKDVDFTKLFPVCYAAIFSVDKRAILDNSVDFYNNIMNTILFDIRQMPYKNKVFDVGLYLEKLWLVIFNYKKYNSNYRDLSVGNYPYEEKNLRVEYSNWVDEYAKTSTIHFSIYSVVSQIYIELVINDKMYMLFLSPYDILLKQGRINIYRVSFVGGGEHPIIKNKMEMDIRIQLDNGKFAVYVNDNIIVSVSKKKNEMRINDGIGKINSAKIFSVTDENKFIDFMEVADVSRGGGEANLEVKGGTGLSKKRYTQKNRNIFI